MKNIFSPTNILIILIIAFSFQGLALAQIQTKTNKQLLLDASQPTVLITGSNRGIGFALVQYYSKNGWNVIATCRSPNKADDLQLLSKNSTNIFIEEMDVTDLEEINTVAQKYQGDSIDVLVNNAGILGNVPKQSFGNLDYDLFQQVMAVNAFGPLKVAEAFADSVAISNQKKIVTITSGLGSFAIMGNSDRFFFYKMSKSAVNMGVLTMNASLKSKGVMAALISPGMVDTRLLDASGYQGRNRISPEESVAGLVKIIAEMSPDTMKKTKGRPTNYNQVILPW